VAASPAYLAIDLVIIGVLVTGIGMFRTPPNARRGTLAASLAMALAIAAVLVRMDISRPALIIVALAVGSFAGLGLALRVNMIQIPAMIAFQHGAGGMAAFLVSFVELSRGSTAGIAALPEVAGLAGLLVGAGTFSASLVAGGKLASILPSRPTVVRGHNWLLLALTAGAITLAVAAGFASGPSLVAIMAAAIAVAAALGVGASVRIGGADMPVLISTLNATAGFAAAFCGIILGSYLLVAAGATVAASGTVLTQVMCKAMNRNLFQVLTGVGSPSHPVRKVAGDATIEATPENTAPAAEHSADPRAAAAEALKNARRAIIVPGYGMAVAQAQFELVSLAKKLEDNGTNVKYAIHPVAGRMPGHMNVLLAEADVPYDRLVEMNEINPEFKDADVALVVGACDVVNPAAIETEGTPISGMPILRAMDARAVVVCNYDDKPGYSGVHNPLYQGQGSILLWGDAKESLGALNSLLTESA
jgi:NAD(P) transhydrogenase subunit beta